MYVLKINREIPVFKIPDSRVGGLTNRNEVFYGKHHCYMHKYLNNQVCSANFALPQISGLRLSKTNAFFVVFWMSEKQFTLHRVPAHKKSFK